MSYNYNDDWDFTDLNTISVTSQSAGSIYTIGTPSSGQVLTTGINGVGASSWATLSVDSSLQGSSLNVKGDANFEGDITVKGKSIVDSLDRIEERLAILRPNEELEGKWENLRGLRKAYMELEAEILEKEKVWKILQK